MGANKRKTGGGQKKHGRFIGIPYSVAESEEFINLEPREKSLLLDILVQRNGRNNGSLSANHTLMKDRGWKSRGSLYRALDGLIDKGFIVKTRLGMKIRGRPTLLAVTWDGIDEPIEGKEYDDHIKVSPIPLNYWRKNPSIWRAK